MAPFNLARAGNSWSILHHAEHFPNIFEPLKQLKDALPAGSVSIDIQGISVRKHTGPRISQLCQLTSMTGLTLFGKSSMLIPHGHRLSNHLHNIAALRNLVSLELLSYEDVCDSELAVLAECNSLKHLYKDSLFIKLASGPVLPSITSFAVARIKFILRPLTSLFPSLQKLRLGVLNSELNKRISSASLSCLVGCTDTLHELVICPVLWKGQWQVLPTLCGLRDLDQIKEIFTVVGQQCPSLGTLELHSFSPNLSPWPGVAAAAAAGLHPLEAIAPDIVVAAAPAAPATGGGDSVEIAAAELTNSMEEHRPLTELSDCRSIRSLVLHDCCYGLIRVLAHLHLPGLRKLVIRGETNPHMLLDLSVFVLAHPKLQNFDVTTRERTLTLLDLSTAALQRPGLLISCSLDESREEASLRFSRGF